MGFLDCFDCFELLNLQIFDFISQITVDEHIVLMLCVKVEACVKAYGSSLIVHDVILFVEYALPLLLNDLLLIDQTILISKDYFPFCFL